MGNNDDCQCNRNYEIIGSSIFGVFVVISEIMPFVKNIKANGVVHAMYQFYQNYTAKKNDGTMGAVLTPDPIEETAPITTAGVTDIEHGSSSNEIRENIEISSPL